MNTEQAFKKANLIIDFTVPKCTFEVLKIASNTKNHRVLSNRTHFSKLKNPICGDEMDISLKIIGKKKFSNKLIKLLNLSEKKNIQK